MEGLISMIRKCKFHVECDNGCGTYSLCSGKRDLKKLQKEWVTYQLVRMNPFADSFNFSQYPHELHFCCQHCADEYFEYWAERRGKYEKIIY